jgi:hypothetical protein
MTHEEPRVGSTEQSPHAKDADASIGGMIFDALNVRMGDLGPSFARYVEEHRTDHWLLFSDYVLQHRADPTTHSCSPLCRAATTSTR